MTEDFDVEVASGGVMKGIARMFSGESMFLIIIQQKLIIKRLYLLHQCQVP